MGCPARGAEAIKMNMENNPPCEWELYERRAGTPMNPNETLIDLPGPVWETDLYKCIYCGRIEAF